MTAVWDLPAVAAGIEQQVAALAAKEAQGATVLGWKVGVGAPAAMRAAGISAPLVGFLTSSTVLESGASVSLNGWVRPVFEAEIAIHLGDGVAPGASPAQAEDAIAALGSAIELADVDADLADLTAVVGGDIFHRAVILGPVDASRSGGVVEGLRARVLRNGEPVAQTDDVTELTGSPVDLVLHVARWLAQMGRQLEAGQVIIGGSVVPIIPVMPDTTMTYECDPLGSLAVTYRA